MTREDQVEKILDELEEEFVKANMPINDKLTLFAKVSNIIYKYAEQEPCDDAISRQAVLSMQYRIDDSATLSTRDVVNVDDIEDLSPVTPEPNRCNQCKYYEGVHKVQGHAPCSFLKCGGVLWDWYCSNYEPYKGDEENGIN